MAIILNDNLKINAGKPIDSRYLTTGNTVYASTGATNSAIPVPLRYTGLTVNILGTEYWYKTGVADINLVQKIYNSTIPIGSFVTGATNIGYFSGQTSIQTLTISTSSGITGNYLDYTGNYSSLYNYYYRGSDQKIHIGTPNDNISKRGYVKISPLPVESWVWNEYTGGSGNRLGWIFVIGDISLKIGQTVTGVIYYTGSSQVYTETAWSAPANNAGKAVINSVLGSLITGTTISIGGPVFATKTNNVLNLRTIMTKTPTLLSVSYDEAFVYLSGNTGGAIINAANGLTKVGQTVKLGGTLTGSTVITDARTGSTAVGIQYGADYSANFTDRSLVDRGYVLSRTSVASGERITKLICQTSHGFNINTVIGWSGGTYNKAIADGTYDGEVIGIVSKCHNTDCFDLTQAGYVTGLTGLSTSITYFLSDVTRGLLTSTEPICNGHISKSVIIANSSSSGWVLPYAGYVISSGVGGPLVKTVCLPTTSTYQMISNDFYIGACCSTIVILPLTPPSGMVVVVADISNCADCGPITIVGDIIGCSTVSCINTKSGSLSYIYNGTRWSVIGFAPAMI